MKISFMCNKWSKVLAIAGAVFLFAGLTGCGGADGFPDGRVDPFAFNTATEVEVNTVSTSNEITVSGIDIPVSISVSGPAGSNPLYNIDGGDFTNTAGKVSNGQTVRVRLTSASENATQVIATLTIGDRTGTFTVSTVGAAIPEVVSATDTAFGARISVADDGTAVAVFIDEDNLFANRYDGLAWGTPVEIDTSEAAVATPNVGTDAAGNAIAVWVQDDGFGENTVFASHYTAGGSWGAPVEIVSAAGWTENGASIAVNASGQAVVAWSQWLDALSTVANYFDGTNWGVSEAIEDSPNSVTNYSGIDTAIDDDGNAVAVWQGAGDATTEGMIFANRYDVSTGWGTHSELGGGGVSFNPQVVFLSTGAAVTVWNQFTGFNGVFSSQTAAGQNSWSTPAAIGDVTEANYPGSLQLAADAGGNAMAAYLKNGDVLYATRYLSGSGWQATATQLDQTPVPFGGEGVALTLDDAGNAFVAYGSDANIFMTTFDISGGTWSTPEEVDISATDAFDPVADVQGSTGKVIYAWQQDGITSFRYTR